MKMIDAIVIWTPVFPPETIVEHPILGDTEDPPGSIRVERRGTDWNRTRGDRWMPATSLGEWGEYSTKDDQIKQLLAMHILFNTITVRDRVPVEAAHAAFLKIDEYRKTISPDTAGADR